MLAWVHGLTAAGMAAHDGSLVGWAAVQEARLNAERDACWAPIHPRLPEDLATLVAEADRLLEEMTA